MQKPLRRFGAVRSLLLEFLIAIFHPPSTCPINFFWFSSLGAPRLPFFCCYVTLFWVDIYWACAQQVAASGVEEPSFCHTINREYLRGRIQRRVKYIFNALSTRAAHVVSVMDRWSQVQVGRRRAAFEPFMSLVDYTTSVTRSALNKHCNIHFLRI